MLRHSSSSGVLRQVLRLRKMPLPAFYTRLSSSFSSSSSSPLHLVRRATPNRGLVTITSRALADSKRRSEGPALLIPKSRGFLSSVLGESMPYVHSDRISKTLRHAPSTVFEVVSDVGSYQNFLPYTVSSKVLTKESPLRGEDVTGFDADLTIGFKIFTDTFRSRVELHHPHKHVIARCIASDTMRSMTTVWSFKPQGEESTRVNFEVRMEIDDPMKAKAIASVYSLIAEAQLEAFEAEINRRAKRKQRVAA